MAAKRPPSLEVLMKNLFIILSCLPFSVAAELQQIDWQTLKPEISNQHIELPEVTDEQRQLLATVMHLQTQQDEQSKIALKNTLSILQAQGLDAMQALDAREKYMALEKEKAEALNSQVDGAKVRMPGFIVPIEFDGVKGTEFLLVPYAGACIHLPPPPANQIVRLSYPQGFEIDNIQYPVWVEGVIQTNMQTQEVYLVDGKTNLIMGYTMKGLAIEKYYEQ
jgi:hypothetical protein